MKNEETATAERKQLRQLCKFIQKTSLKDLVDQWDDEKAIHLALSVAKYETFREKHWYDIFSINRGTWIWDCMLVQNTSKIVLAARTSALYN